MMPGHRVFYIHINAVQRVGLHAAGLAHGVNLITSNQTSIFCI